MKNARLFYILLLLSSVLVNAKRHQKSVEQTGAKTELPIVVVVASYNNKNWYKLNLDSIFKQKYTNYRILYIDDCSPDGTGDLVEAYVKEKGQAHRVTVIKNTERKKALANIYNAVHSCQDNEIVALVDGDDFVAHINVFNVLNRTYSDPNIWLTFSQFFLLPHNQRGWGKQYPADIIERNAFREYQGTPTHMRTFYAGLFKKIKLEDLMYEGDFFSMTYDMAIMLPMVEMARKGHYAFINKVLYLYNDMTPINDHKVNKGLQKKLDLEIRSRERYEALTKLF